MTYQECPDRKDILKEFYRTPTFRRLVEEKENREEKDEVNIQMRLRKKIK